MIYDIDVNKRIVPSKIPFGKRKLKYFTGHEDNESVVPLCVMLPKMNGYRKYFDEVRYIPLSIKYDELLE